MLPAKCSSNLGLGVKSQSKSAIAGSYQSWPKSSLEGDNSDGRDTDSEFRLGNRSVLSPTPNFAIS